MTQIIGRMHQLGQTQKVHVYQILVVDFFDGPTDDPNEGEGVIEPGDGGCWCEEEGKQKGGKKGKGRVMEPSGTDTVEAAPPPAEVVQPSGTNTAEAALPPPVEAVQPSRTDTAEQALPPPAEGPQRKIRRRRMILHDRL